MDWFFCNMQSMNGTGTLDSQCLQINITVKEDSRAILPTDNKAKHPNLRIQPAIKRLKVDTLKTQLMANNHLTANNLRTAIPKLNTDSINRAPKPIPLPINHHMINVGQRLDLTLLKVNIPVNKVRPANSKTVG